MRIDKEFVYSKCPVGIQNALCSIEGWRIKRFRYAREFYQTLEKKLEGEAIYGDELKSYQRRRLSEHLNNASQTKFWSRRFAEFKLDLKANKLELELQKLPILSKQEVQHSVDDIVNSAVASNDVTSMHTSGTTGAGLIFPVSKYSMWEQWATWWRYRLLHGISTSTWCAYFGGRLIVPIQQQKPPYWRMNNPGKQLMFSAYHLNSVTAPDYVSEIKRRAISWLHGYPSVLALLASYVMEQGLDIGSSIKIITTGAESLQSHQLKVMEAAFQCPVRQHYGLAEGVANISQKVEGEMCVDEDFAYVEFVKDEASGSYKIVGTNWTNAAFPLIRYDTGDLADICEITNNLNGWRLVNSIDGRKEDYITLRDGTKLGRLDHIFKNFTEIREAQIYQEDVSSIILRIIKNNNYTNDTESKLIAETRKRVGNDLEISCVYVRELERSDTGKLKFVISHA